MPLFSGATYDGPPRGYGKSGTPKMYIAIHNTANTATPKAEAQYAKRRTDNVSAHFYADPKSVVQSLDTNYDAWHAGSRTGNTKAIAWELTGLNSWSADYWRSVIDRAAPVLAEVCKRHGIPVQWVSVADMRAGKTGGFVTHDDMRRAWGGTTHTDPGPNFPRDYLVKAVKRHMGAADKPASKPATAKAETRDWTEGLIMALPTLKRGSKGQKVKVLQGLANAFGARLAIDGVFGPKTETWVKTFQKSRSLATDGIVGPKTWAALLK